MIESLLLELHADDDCILASYSWVQDGHPRQAFLFNDLNSEMGFRFYELLSMTGYRVSGVKDTDEFPFAQDIVSLP